MNITARRSRKQKRKSGFIFKLVLFLVLIILLAAAFGRKLADPFIPGTEHKDLDEWFELSDGEVKLYLDETSEPDVLGMISGTTVYLPYSYVSENLNRRFYYSSTDGMLSYTLPDRTADYTADSVVNGNPVFIESGGSLMLSIDLIRLYTDVNVRQFISDDAPDRMFLERGGWTSQAAEVIKDEAVRTGRDIKAPILTNLKKGDSVIVTSQSEEWSRVYTGDGLSGYMRNKALGECTEYMAEHTYEEPEVDYRLLSEKVTMAWHGVYNEYGNDSFDELYGNTAGAVNVISPTWIQVSGENGEYINLSSADYITKAHEAGVKVWACVDNFNQEGGLSDFDTGTYFASAANRRDFIARLMADAESYGYDGINIDFEGISEDAGESFSQFFRELSVECHKRNLTLSIDNPVPYYYNEQYNLPEQGVFADYVVIMAYDEHTGTDIGSVASIGYEEYGINETLNSVPAERIICGCPLYTRLWTTVGGVISSETMGMEDAASYAKRHDMTITWEQETGQNYAELDAGGAKFQMWLEDEESLALKMESIRIKGLGGVAFWRLGYEPQSIWKTLEYTE